MALTASGLSAAIKAELDASAPAGSAETGESGATWRQAFADDLGAAIVAYITANAVVSTTVTGTDSMGGPITGAGTGNIS